MLASKPASNGRPWGRPKSVEKQELWLTGRSYVNPKAIAANKSFVMNIIQERAGATVDVGLPWWAVYTRHQHEKTVAQLLSTKGFEVFLPLYDSMRRWRDRSKLLSLPLFPGYVFLRGGLGRRLHVLTTPGVHTILSNGEKIAAIPDQEIDAIRRAVNSPARVEPHPFLRCGERVRVTRGSLEGVQGVLVRKKSMYRLVLSVEMLAQSVAVEVDAADVEPTKARSLGGQISHPEATNGASSKDALYHGIKQNARALSR
jgi:transcription antitermination factor NusG